ncbi:MAG TPA: Fe-S cluster assembly protein SufD [Tepidiformaceae bacterium]
MSSAIENTSASGLLSAALSRALGERLEEPEWLAEIRARGAAVAAALPAPIPSAERPWKYYDPSDLRLDSYTPGVGATQRGTADEIRGRYGIDGEYAAVLVQQNSETVANWGENEAAVVDFRSADEKQLEVIRKHYGTVVPVDRNKFTGMHYGFQRGAVLVDVPANAEIRRPIRIVRNFEQGGQFAAPHTLVVTGENSRVSIIEDFRSSEEDILVVPAVELVPGPGSEIRHTTLHRWGSETTVLSEQRTVTERDSAIISLSLATGGKVVKSHLESSLVGRGSSSELFGLFLGDEGEHINFFTLQDHIGPDTRSDLLFKAALKGQARAVYYGLTRVGLGAKNADANQVNRNLLLSKTARADSDPVLEILTNDVIRVSHGATAGPVDEEQLYYLQTRGIPHAEAEALLVRAFLGQVLDRIPDDALREELTNALEAKLEREA